MPLRRRRSPRKPSCALIARSRDFRGEAKLSTLALRNRLAALPQPAGRGRAPARRAGRGDPPPAASSRRRSRRRARAKRARGRTCTAPSPNCPTVAAHRGRAARPGGTRVREIAQVLGLELGTVRSRLHRARADLKGKL
jgi:hypothetical protein